MKTGSVRYSVKLSLLFIISLLKAKISYDTFVPFLNSKPVIEASRVTDVRDPRRLVGISHNVFIGHVISNEGVHYVDSRMPETKYSVDVLENLKGNLEGVILLNQQGGVDNFGELNLFEDDPLHQTGRTYLFATRYTRKPRWHTLIPVYGDIPLESYHYRNGNNQLEAKDVDTINLFRDAVKHEIPYIILNR